jgi:hypothetical protein
VGKEEERKKDPGLFLELVLLQNVNDPAVQLKLALVELVPEVHRRFISARRRLQQFPSQTTPQTSILAPMLGEGLKWE